MRLGSLDFDFHCRKKAPGVAAAVALYLTVVRNSSASSPERRRWLRPPPQEVD